jgi:ketosteroid isomerase-like protein
MATQSNDRLAAEIRALEDRRCQAMIDKDMKTLEALYADELVYTHSNAAVDDKKSYLAGITSGKFDYKAIKRHDESIKVVGDAAICTGRAQINVRSSGVDRALNSRYLIVWVKRSGGWQAVAWQSTPIPQS